MRRLAALACIFFFGIALLLQQGYLNPAAANTGVTPPAFVDVSRPAGIVNNRVADNEMAAGQAWGDYDNDGWIDLYVTDSSGPNTLYRNNGDGTFSVSPLAGDVKLPKAYSGGATFVDYDNDGWSDLYVANWGQDNLFHNENGQRFVDVTAQAGIQEEANTKTASWGDYDSDGYLDLYIANWSCYPKCGRQMDGESDRLYHNNGDGTFTNVSDYLGGSLNGAGFVASFTDYDNDGDQDIYLVNDEFINPIGNKLFRNDGPGCKGWCFTQVAREAGAEAKVFGMGLAAGDYDNDGDVDFYFSNVGPMTLLQNQGNGTFIDVAEQAGVRTPNSIGWGAVFLDYNNDGWRDLYLAVADTTNHRDTGANKLFRNNTDGTFSLVACENEAADIRMSLGVAYADYDQDGWVDLVVGNMDEGYRLYRNQTRESENNRWLALELEGEGRVNRDAVGARVYLATENGIIQMQEVINGASLGAGNELALYFGLGQSRTAALKIRWPDGTEQVFEDVTSNQRYHLVYPEGGNTSLIPVGASHDLHLQGIARDRPLPVPEVILSLLALALLSLAAIGLRSGVRNEQAGSVGFDLPLVSGALAAAGLIVFLGLGFQALDVRTRILGLSPDVDVRLAYLMEHAQVQPPTSPEAPSPALVKLGEALFWDPILSGNKDISCATCHHPQLGTGDNLSVSIGTAGEGLGEVRTMGVGRELIPRNAPPVYNLGYTEWTVMFWDGRVSTNTYGGFNSPASDRLPGGLDSVLAAQAMFPVTSREEMRGRQGDKDIFGQPNELGKIVDYTSRPIWDGLIKRLLAIPGYVALFQAAYPELGGDQLGFQHAANAMAAYEIAAFTLEDSPFDRYIRGDRSALTENAKQGALLFYGKAGCAECHSGGLLTDQKFYNLAVPQIGPGKAREQPIDLGRARETGNDCDRFAFRTPPLRNVAITGPWMHDGAYVTLEAAIRHHLEPAASLQTYDPTQLAALVEDTCQDQPEMIAAVLATVSQNPSQDVQLSESEIHALLLFLEALTSPSALHLEHTIPAFVPSGLQVGGLIGNIGVESIRVGSDK
jgi:cytochrome c peroxidase